MTTNADAIFNKYEALLENGRFIEGEHPTQADNAALKEVEANLSELSPAKHPHLFGWYCMTYKFHANLRAKWPAASQSAAKKDDVDEMDLFGDDDEDDDAAKKAAAAAKEKAQAGKKKKQVVAMSLVMLEVKPLDDTTNLDDLA